MAHALKPAPPLGVWLRETALAVARRPEDDWIGPPFRDHAARPAAGNLETAHLTWGLAAVLDLAEEIFTESERRELCDALRDKGIALCRRWLDRNDHLTNWRCMMNAGVAVAAAVLNDREALAGTREEFLRCQDAFQPDGSYGESLQYGNYAAMAQMLAWEALARREPENPLPLAPYVHYPRWAVSSLLYQKPLSGWGDIPMPRSVNFNDSGAVFRPSADLLLHIAARGRTRHPAEAGLARWLFDRLYLETPSLGADDRAGFGFVNGAMFLALPLLAGAAEAVSPTEAAWPSSAHFGCGDAILRQSWEGRTVLATRGGGEALHASGHLHDDLHSFVLVHNRERLLLDPGHSCYRNLARALETSSDTHNTCTFVLASGRPLAPRQVPRRRFDPRTGVMGIPVDRGARRLLFGKKGAFRAVASEAAEAYGPPLRHFMRFWFLCGEHVVFVVDWIAADEPIRTSWNWLFNNRDGLLDLRMFPPDRLVARRGRAGMKLHHTGGGALAGPTYAYVHDAYHPLPGQAGEGKPGSGFLMGWREQEASLDRLVTHAICLDDRDRIAGWHFRAEKPVTVVTGPDAGQVWKLQIETDPLAFVLEDSGRQERCSVFMKNEAWQLQ